MAVPQCGHRRHRIGTASKHVPQRLIVDAVVSFLSRPARVHSLGSSGTPSRRQFPTQSRNIAGLPSGFGLSPRPRVCRCFDRDAVMAASITHSTVHSMPALLLRSNPSANSPTFQTTCQRPSANSRSACLRFLTGVFPSRCIAGTPARLNADVKSWLCLIEFAKPMVFLPRARLIQCSTIWLSTSPWLTRLSTSSIRYSPPRRPIPASSNTIGQYAS